MHVMELARIPARVTGAAQDRTVASTQGPDYVVFAVGHEQIILVCIPRKSDIISGTVAQRLFSQKEFLEELSFFCEDLDTVVDTVADIDEPII